MGPIRLSGTDVSKARESFWGSLTLEPGAPWYCRESKYPQSRDDGRNSTGCDRQRWFYDMSYQGLTRVMERRSLLTGIFQIHWCLHFPTDCVLPGKEIPDHGMVANSFHSLGVLLPPAPGPRRDTEIGYFDPAAWLHLSKDICSQMFYLWAISLSKDIWTHSHKDAFQVLSLFTLYLSLCVLFIS